MKLDVRGTYDTKKHEEVDTIIYNLYAIVSYDFLERRGSICQ